MEAVDLGAENDERMARLREALALGEGFQLVIVQVEPGEQREEVLRRLQGWAGRSGVPWLELVCLAPGESPVMRLEGEHAGVILVGLEADGVDKAERTRTMATELNWSRDRLPERVHGPLVLVVSQRVQSELFEQAPDFYSWRMHSTSIVPQPRALGRLPPWFEPEPEDPAVLEAMIAETSALEPPAIRELGRLYARLARARALRGEDAEAEAALDAAYDAYVRAGTLDDRVDLLLLRSDLAARTGRKEDASAWLEQARQKVRSGLPGPDVSAKLLFHEAMHALDRGDFRSAAAALPPAIEAVTTLGDLHKEATLLIGGAALAFHLHAMQEEKLLLERAVELLHDAGQLALEAAALTLCARAAALAGRSDEAEQYGLDAVARAEASGSANTVAEARARLGRIALANGHLELADEVLRGEVAAVGTHPGGELAEARAHLALCRRDDADAERHLRAALEAYRREGSPWEVAKISLEIAELGRRTQNWTLALTGFEAADRLGDTGQRAVAALGLAELSLARGEVTAAIADQLAVASQMAVAADAATLADRSRWLRGAVLLALGRDAEGRMELEIALAGFETRGQAERAAEVRDLLAQLGERSSPRSSDSSAAVHEARSKRTP
jgi:hypothetical protein